MIESNVEGLLRCNYLSRINALKRYYLDPTYCQECNFVIEVMPYHKVRDIRERKFCSRKCSALYHGRFRIKTGIKNISNKKYLKLSLATKQEVFENAKNYGSANTNIRKHARNIFKNSNKKLECFCGYNVYVDISHIMPVAKFPPETMISEINSLENLIAMCPNHHWEFDNGILDLNMINLK